ncbi:MAG: 16S rRNA (cytosine(967)-C(5))-methyltransferase RsmB [Deltaproteobacteria bacterium]|nr:16S rRNA (cytosine(967)-C(5))-methyltransferase RsmB [Deltaproteobacteria bacterium]
MSTKGPRVIAHQILNRVEGGAYADILLDSMLSNMGRLDAAFTTELVYGVLRWSIRLDWAIDSFSSIKTAKLERGVLNALRLGAYQLLFLTKVPASAAINESVNLIRGGGSKKAGFVNAVLRKIDSERDGIKLPGTEDDPVRHISVLYSHPEWLVRRWMGRYGFEETAGLCKAAQEVPPRVIRVNTLLATREGLIEELALAKEGRGAKATEFSPDGIIISGERVEAKDKRYYIQDEASQIVPYLLSAAPGEAVLDACSAPGGKTTHIAQLMKNTGVICALDVNASRVKAVEDLAERLGVKIIKTFEADAAQPLSEGLPAFDAILCDAPCSGLGVIRRTPDIKLKRREGDIAGISETQKKILDNVSGYVKKGGRIVYSTCTFEPEETDENIEWFLGRHRDFILEDARRFLPQSCEALVDSGGFLRTFPHRHNMDGFFAARLKKV